MSQHTKRRRYMKPSNVSKFALLDASKTYKQTFMTSQFGIIELFVNPNMNVGISTDKTTVYRLTKDGKDVATKLSNSYVCIAMSIANTPVKCSRNILIEYLFGNQPNIEFFSHDNTNSKYKIEEMNGRHFDPKNTYVDQSLGHNFVRNPDVSLYFDLDTYEFYTPKGTLVASTNGLKSTAYVVYADHGKRIMKTMRQINVVAMMYGIDIPKGAVTSIIKEGKPLTKDNIKFVAKNEYMKKNAKIVSTGLNRNQAKSKSLVSEYMTEDFSKFLDRKEALEHQIKVDKAKEVIQLFIDNKCGHSVAEKAFLKIMEVDRHNAKYKHFIDVLKNDQGILEVKKESMKVDLNVKIDTLIINASDKEVANTLINEINERVSKLKNL